jgi:RNA polymerase sigma factor (sigma-70 family)
MPRIRFCQTRSQITPLAQSLERVPTQEVADAGREHHHMTTDAQLMLAAQTDAGAFRQLYERHAANVHGYHLRRCGDRDAAFDLTAETFAQAWLSRTRFRDDVGGSAGPWIFGIARNVLLMSVRKHALERSACERLGVLNRLDAEPATAEPSEHWLDGLDEALAELTEEQRRAIELRIIDDLDYDQVADRAGSTPQVARARVSRGLATLRHRFADSRGASQ